MTDFKVVVCAAIRNSKNQILLARRAPDKKLGGFWEFPGGKLEHGEELEVALKREILEELELEIEIEQLIHIKPYQYDHAAVLILFYLCSARNENFVLKDHDRAEWVGVDNLASFGLLPANEEAIAKLRHIL